MSGDDATDQHGRRTAFAELLAPPEPPSRIGEQLIHIPVDLPRLQRRLWAATAFLVVMDFLASAAAARDAVPYTITRFFDGDSKVNVPTGAKTTLLLAATLLMLCCWTAGKQARDPAARGWLHLAAVTGFAFVDETTYLHQSVSDALRHVFELHGVLKFAWTIVYLPAAVVVGVFLIRHLRSMRPQIRARVMLGGAVYTAGALLFEPVKSHYSESRGEGSLAFKLLAAMSDSLQLVGLTLLVCAVLYAVRAVAHGLLLDLTPSAAPASRTRSQSVRLDRRT